MKLTARLFLFLFIAFLSTPMIKTLIEKSTNTSISFSISEEEQVKKEVKAELYFLTFPVTFELKKTNLKNLVFLEYLSKLDYVFRVIFSPPPNFT
ncbi:hypothetical protein [Flavobacterium flavipallidum]|uniref:Uncharacterized protein n=1 Tax=Flavobacterium flavipallidum TaxID=3139140 RepID=A0ABU9HQS1_9FLAO